MVRVRSHTTKTNKIVNIKNFLVIGKMVILSEVKLFTRTKILTLENGEMVSMVKVKWFIMIKMILVLIMEIG